MSANNERSPTITVVSPAVILMYTDTERSDYPLYVLPDMSLSKRRTKGAKATFYVKSVGETTEEVTHDLLQTAVEAIKEVTKAEPEKKVTYKIVYEIYAGTMERLVGEAVAYLIVLLSKDTPYSGIKWGNTKAYAIAYSWRDRITAKYPSLSGYVSVTGTETWGSGRARAWIVVKLPVVTPEFERLYGIVMTANVTNALELEKKAEELKRLIEEKERELQQLREQYQQLLMKLQLERMKSQVASV